MRSCLRRLQECYQRSGIICCDVRERYRCCGGRQIQRSYSRVFASRKRNRANPLQGLSQQKKKGELGGFFKLITIWNLLFWGVGQWLFGGL